MTVNFYFKKYLPQFLDSKLYRYPLLQKHVFAEYFMLKSALLLHFKQEVLSSHFKHRGLSFPSQVNSGFNSFLSTLYTTISFFMIKSFSAYTTIVY